MSLKTKKVKVNGDTYEVRQLSVKQVFSAMKDGDIDNLKMLEESVTHNGDKIVLDNMSFADASPLIKAMNELNGFVGNES